MNTFSITIITGQSGSGKSTAVRALEDQGFLCIDNLPVALVPALVQSLEQEAAKNPEALPTQVAWVIDARQPAGLSQMQTLLNNLHQGQHRVRIVYLEAREEALLRRYSETRRAHPLDTGADGQGLQGAIDRERELLAPLRELAEDTIDTSGLSVHELRAKIIQQVAGAEVGDNLSVSLSSFGFKRGLPLDCDMVLDVRFLRNPYFNAKLRPRTGKDPEVRDYIFATDEAQHFVERTLDYLAFLLPHFQREGKRYLTIGIGCTGGQHRSVAMVETLSVKLANLGFVVDMRHRDAREPEVTSVETRNT